DVGTPGRDRLGPDSVRLRQQPRGRDREDALRPLLHQAPVVLVRSPDPLRHGEDRALWTWVGESRCVYRPKRPEQPTDLRWGGAFLARVPAPSRHFTSRQPPEPDRVTLR